MATLGLQSIQRHHHQQLQIAFDHLNMLTTIEAVSHESHKMLICLLASTFKCGMESIVLSEVIAS